MSKAINSKSLRMLYLTCLVFSTVIFCLLILQHNQAQAALGTWYVTTSGNDANPCNSPAMPCATLQVAADKAAAGDTILAASDTFADGLTLSKDLIMSGGWDPTFTIQNGMTTIDLNFVWSKGGIGVNEGVTAQIEYVTIKNASTNGFGGGLSNSGNLMLSHCVITNNQGFYGSGVYNSGTMTISDCSIDHNHDAYYGGGVYNGGDLTILNSSIDHNNASNAGGLFNNNDYINSTVVVKDSSIWANQAGIGGGIENMRVLEMSNTTVAENYADDSYAGIYHASGSRPDTSLVLNNCSVVGNYGLGLIHDSDTVHLQNTIMIGNTAGDTLNQPHLDGYNLIGTILYPFGEMGPGNIIGVHQIVVYPLEGWPAYAPLTPYSLAIDHGDPSGCHDNHGNLLNTDMRGMPRFGRCDIGAFEIQPIEFSVMSADHYQPHIESLVTYQIDLNNPDTVNITDGHVTNDLPVSFSYITDTLKASSGEAAYNQGRISWNGTIEAGKSVSIEYQVNVGTVTGNITNTTIITTSQEVLERSARVWVSDKYYTYMPCTDRVCGPIFQDDFSNSGSGWPIESGNDYSMGYQNGEYFINANEGWIAWAVRDCGVSDFQIKVDARAQSNLYGSTAIFFSATDYGFYTFEISDGWFSVWRYDSVSQHWTVLINWTPSGAIYPGLGTNRMEVSRVGSNIKVYANGQLLGTLNDGTYVGTYSGLAVVAYSGTMDGRFDNFEIYAGKCIGSNIKARLTNFISSSGGNQIASGAGRKPVLLEGR